MEELSAQALSALILSLQYLLVTCILTSMHIKQPQANALMTNLVYDVKNVCSCLGIQLLTTEIV